MNPSENKLILRITSVVAVGEEQPMEPGTEYFVGSLELKFTAGTVGNAECTAGAAIRIHPPATSGMIRGGGIYIYQPGLHEAIETEADVSNCVTFRNPPTNQCPGGTPTQKSTWGSIKAIYR